MSADDATASGPPKQPISTKHFTAVRRAALLIMYLCAINLAGGVFIWKVVGCSAAQRDYAIILGAFVTVLIGAPLIAFLCLGWYTRYREFENSLKGSALSAYLQRYWSKRLIDALIYAGVLNTPADNDSWRDLADRSPKLCDRVFASIYHEQYGLTPFVPPFLILLCIAYAGASLIACNYTPGACDAATASTCVYGISQEVLLASFGGALMFVVSDSVLSIRRKALNVSDVYWYALRIMLAVPLALVVGGADGAHTAVAFALGTFPVDALMKIIRRFGFPQLTQLEKEENSPDKLLSLNGVTLPIVSVFEAEGVNSVEQIAAADPVLLSIRTGFPFRYTLRLCSQAIVRRHFGEDAAKLIPIGLADVVPVYLLVKAMDGSTSPSLPAVEDKDNVIKDAAIRLFPNDDNDQRISVTRMKFRQIAAEEFTVMLARITPLDPAL